MSGDFTWGITCKAHLTFLLGPVMKFTLSENFCSRGMDCPSNLANRKGDGDVLGVDIAIAVLDQNVMDIILLVFGCKRRTIE